MGENMFSVVVPVYNAERSLNELCERITRVFENVVKSEFEVILVNDGSKDHSWEVMKALHKKDNRIKVIDLAKNMGQHSAMICGLNNFSGDFVILMDDDLQHFPEEIPKLIEPIVNDDSLDVVIGTFEKKKHSLIRNVGSAVMNKMSRMIFKTDKKIRSTNFRIIRANIARTVAAIRVGNPRIGQLILYTTRRIDTVAVRHDERKYGKSGYTFRRLVRDFVLNIIGNSPLPLRWISYIGLFVSLISFIIAGYYLLRYLFVGTSVVGWTSLIVTVTFFSGFILLALGIIGEYLIRILKENYKLPNYVEREKYL